MKKLKIGITGQSGFVGTHLTNNINFVNEKFDIVPFEDSFFDKIQLMNSFVEKCDVIIHLAGVNRHEDENYIFKRNIELANILVKSLNKSKSKTHLIFSSSIQESNDNLYGKSKLKAREILVSWSKQSGNIFTGLLIPNLFGPFGKPNYNSVISTFCYKLVNNENPAIIQDSEIKLLYIQDLCEKIFQIINDKSNSSLLTVVHEKKISVTKILFLLKYFKKEYIDNGNMPKLNDDFEIKLFNTFRSYIDPKLFFPKKYVKHSDERGCFIELLRSGLSGQFSFSTTNKGYVRGNHFHTRKIERFSVIEGKALIEFRRIDKKEKYSFILDGSKPACIDMPIWYTHNIKNIGNKSLITNFWINEQYDPIDPDTFYINV
jgi:UDP-2-acetamido-2,6-beta-L-arabino-hexul-4-ose reductase